jgi:glycolate oxidase iron-sulfur subunit
MRLALRQVVPRRRLFGALLKAASAVLSLWPGARRGRLRHLPMLAAGWRWLPRVVWRPATRRLGGRVHGPEDGGVGGKRAVLFVGCLTNHVYPEVAAATVRLLARAGYEVVVPRRQVCCGTPALAMGDVKAARKVAERNRGWLLAEKPDVIVTACATCGSALKRDYPEYLGEEVWAGVPVRDVTEVLAAAGLSAGGDGGVRVSFHDPCHLRYGQGLLKEPRRLLGGFEVVELDEAGTCCGGGGAFTMAEPELSAQVSARKLSSIRRAAPSVVATACPGCIMHLEHILTEAGEEVRVRHVVELLDEGSGERL